MAAILTELFKVNIDAQRAQQYPAVSSIELQSQNDATRVYAKIVAVTEGWMFHREVWNPREGQRQPQLVLTENAVTDAVDTLLTEAMVMDGLRAVIVDGQRYECRNPIKPQKEPRHFLVECEWIGAA